jgi:hypothetical protein
MQARHFILGIALLLLTGVVSAAQAKTLHVHCKGAATVADGVETNIDTDGDGTSATLVKGSRTVTLAGSSSRKSLNLFCNPP